jgi:triacylglycerol lipase
MQDAPKPDLDLRAMVAPELRPCLDSIPPLELTHENLALLRAPAALRQPAFVPPPLTPAQQAVRCEQVFVPGPPGAPDVRALLYTPPGEPALRPAYLHLHGGGYVLGMPENNDGSNREIASRHGCMVLSVDYRLAPETRHPGPLEDCYAALAWLHRESAPLGIDASRIAIGGESAGGGHAAALALLARDRGEYPICFQLLDSPMLDDRSVTPPPFGEYTWGAAHNRFGWRALLGCEPGSADVPDGAVPARAARLEGLPPSFIVVGAIDLFADEDIAYARRLIAAGVPTELHVIPGAFHGFAVAGDAAPQVRALMRYRDEALSRAFGRQHARV